MMHMLFFRSGTSRAGTYDANDWDIDPGRLLCEQAEVPDSSLRKIADIIPTEPKKWIELYQAKTKLLGLKGRRLDAKQKAHNDTVRPSVATVVGKKRTLLMKEALGSFKFPDAEIASELGSGIRLSGKIKHSPSFNEKQTIGPTSPSH